MFKFLKKAFNNWNYYWKNHHHSTVIYNPKTNISEDMLKETFKNPVAMACINYLSRNIHSFKISHNFNQFFKNNFHNFLEEVILEWMIHGNCFIKYNENILELQVLKTLKIRHHGTKIFYNGEKINNIIHLKNYHPYEIDVGFSPLNTVFSHIQQYNTINHYLNTIAGRGGITSGILISKNYLNKEDRENLHPKPQNPK